jgi:magnesium-transporting ATPase (P-type)
LDRAILQHTEVHEHPAFPEYAKVDEIPFDFVRRMMSVVVKTPANAHRLICSAGGNLQAVQQLRSGRPDPAHGPWARLAVVESPMALTADPATRFFVEAAQAEQANLGIAKLAANR